AMPVVAVELCCFSTMAAAGGLGSVRRLWELLLVLALARVAVALTEQYPTLSLLKQELHQQRQGLAGGCASAGEWAEQYSAECGESASGRQNSRSDSDSFSAGLSPSSLTLQYRPEKTFTQSIAYVLIGNGLYDEAIRQFSTMLQVSFLFGLLNEALSDLTKAIQLQPSARLYRHRGTLYFISEVSRFGGSCLVLVAWVFLLLSFFAFSTSCYCCLRASLVFK
uniref:Tetratricopeptide repeat domain 13 n=1 Tax=Pavo cristatus TaxID=9049 RepID=A0A8C9EXN7_PAVCR